MIRRERRRSPELFRCPADPERRRGWPEDGPSPCDGCRVPCSALDQTARYLAEGIDETWRAISAAIAGRRQELDSLLEQLAAAGGLGGRRSSDRPIRTVIVSGSEEAKRQLCHKVGGDRRFSVVGEAATPDAAVALAAGDLPDLVLVHLVQLEPRALAQLAGLGGWSPRTALVLVSGIDVSRAGDLLVTSTVAEDWPFAQLAPTVAPPGGNGDHPRRATAELPAPARAVPPPRRSIIHEAMRQIGVPMRRKQ